jgi:hypothetical protein
VEELAAADARVHGERLHRARLRPLERTVIRVTEDGDGGAEPRAGRELGTDRRDRRRAHAEDRVVGVARVLHGEDALAGRREVRLTVLAIAPRDRVAPRTRVGTRDEVRAVGRDRHELVRVSHDLRRSSLSHVLRRVDRAADGGEHEQGGERADDQGGGLIPAGPPGAKRFTRARFAVRVGLCVWRATWANDSTS